MLGLCLVATAGLVTAQQRGSAPASGPFPLVATAHPPLPNDLSLYWYVPDTTARPSGPGRADVAAANRLARGVQMVATGDFVASLPLLSTTGLAGTPLENYAAYFTGDVVVTEIEGVGKLLNTICAPAPLRGSEPDFVQGPSSPAASSS